MTVLTALSPLALGPQSSQDTLTQAINDLMGALNGQEATAVAIKGQFRYPYGTPNISRVLTVNTETGTVTTNGTTTLTGASTLFLSVLKVGDSIWVDGETVRTVATIASNTSLTVTLAFSTSVGSLSYSVGNTAWAAAGTPGAHASTHSSGQTDPISLQNLAGAVTDAQVPNTITLDNITQITTRLHSSLGALTADDHSQYALLAGRATGQILIGDTASGGNLTLQSTSHATRGKILFGANSAYDEANTRLGIGANTPAVELDVIGAGAVATGVSRYHALLLDSTAMAQDVGLAVVLGGKYQSAGLGGGTAGFAAIKGHKENATDGNTAGALVFYTRPAAGNLTEVLRLPSTGGMTLVGNITLSTAGATVDGVDVGAHAGGTAYSQHTGGLGSHTHQSAGAEGNYLNASAINAGNLAFARMPTGGDWNLTSDMFIETSTLMVGVTGGAYSGRIGIGTTTPVNLLELKGPGLTSQTFFRILDSGGVEMLNAESDASGNAYLTIRETVGTAKVHLDTADDSYFMGGDVGVGIDSPLTRFSAVGTGVAIGAANAVLSATQDQVTYRGVYLGYDATGGAQIGMVAAGGTSSILAFWTHNGTVWGERMRIGATGDVTIAAGNLILSGVGATVDGVDVGAIPTTYAPLASPTFTGTVTMPTPFTLGAISVTATGTQLNYLNAATGTTGTTNTNLVFSTSPTLVTPILGTPTSGTLTNCTGLPIVAGTTGTLTVARGGTGVISLTQYAVLYGNAATDIQALALHGATGLTKILGQAASGAAPTWNTIGLTITVAATNATAAEKLGADYICDGTDDAEQINTAIDWCYATSSYGAGRVQFTSGKFSIATATRPVRVSFAISPGADETSGIVLAGAGKQVTEFEAADATGNLFELGETGYVYNHISLRDFSCTVKTGITRTYSADNCAAFYSKKTWGYWIERVLITKSAGTTGYYFGLDDALGTGGRSTLRDVQIYSTVADAGQATPPANVYLRSGGDGWVFNNVTMDNTSTYGYRLSSCSGVYFDQCDTLSVVRGLYIDPAATKTVYHIFGNGAKFDSCTADGLTIDPGTGVATKMWFNHCWFTSASTNGVNLVAAAYNEISQIYFNGCQFINNTARGIIMSGYCEHISVLGSTFLGGLAAKTTVGIEVDDAGAAARYINIRNTYIGNSRWGAADALDHEGFTTGLSIDANCTTVSYSGLTFNGNTTNMSNSATAYWAQIYSGNIGIGMAPVTDIFEVAGNIRLAVSSAVNRGFTIERTGTGAATWTIHSPSNSSDLRFYRGSDLVTITSTGHVGVKTATPDVEGLGANYAVLNMRAIVDRYPSILYLAGQTDTIGDAGGDLIWGIYRTTGGTWNRLARLEGTTSGALNTGQVNLWLNTAGVESVRYKFQADGTALADVAWNTFSPQPPKPETQMLPDDYLDWALEHARKPVKPYSGIPDDPAEVKKYAKDLARISIGTARYVEHLRGVVAVQAQDIVSLRVEVEQLKARLN